MTSQQPHRVANNKSIANILQHCPALLQNVSLTPRLDVELLLAATLQCTRTYLYAHQETELNNQQLSSFQTWLTERQTAKPIAYILGKQEFWSLELSVNENVLIPRAETELLVETTLNLLQTRDNGTKLEILELGTGSGAIALALATTCPNWHITATDNSEAALQVAISNAKKHHITNVTFRQSDWFNAIPPQQFAAIISNPPYIAINDPALEPAVAQFEPHDALISGNDGLDAIRKIIATAPNYLATNGWLLLEHGYQQKTAVCALLAQHGFSQIRTLQDLSGHDRVSVASGPGPIN